MCWCLTCCLFVPNASPTIELAVVENNDDSVRLLEKDESILFAWDLTLGMYDLSGDTRTLVAEAHRMGAGEGQWMKEGMEERQRVDNRRPVMGKLETAGSSHRKGGNLCQGVEGMGFIWRSGGSLFSPCQYLIPAQL